MSSTAYQSKNEDVAIGFFRNNQVATPVGVVKLKRNMGATEQPVVEKEALFDPAVGKANGRDPNVAGFNAGSNDVIKQ